MRMTDTSLLSSLLQIDSKPFGSTFGEWSAKWWQWLLSIPKCNNPAYDSVGSEAYINQDHKPVFFLCQTYEAMDIIPSRTVTLPEGYNLIFIPIINWISILHHDGDTDEDLLAIAKERMDVISSLKLAMNQSTIDDGLENFRVMSPFFEVVLPEDNIIGLQPGVRRAVSDGYWVFVDPRDTDKLVITTFGSCSAGVTRIGVTYKIQTISK
jgi:hypothetical protein